MRIVPAIALFLFAALPAAAQPTAEELAASPPLFLETMRKQLKWDEPAEPTTIIGPIYAVGTKGLSVFLITTSEGHILLNTGMPGSGPLIEAAIRKLGFKPEDIKILLVGHAHCDHAGGLAYLKKLSGAKMAVIREEKELVETGGKSDFFYGRYQEFEFEPVKVDWVFHDGDMIKLGDVAIQALLTNGHTNGSTTFIMNVVDSGKSYTVVFPNGTSINPGYSVVKGPSYPGIENDLRRTLYTLESLKPDIWFYAHTDAYGYDAKLARSKTEGTKAWVDPQGYRRWVSAQRAKLESTIDKELGIAAETK
jgi:metallo-beta-lactamase class B